MRAREWMVIALCACGPEPAAPPAADPPAAPATARVDRDRALHAARGAPVQTREWSGPWALRVSSLDAADPGAVALAQGLGATLQPFVAPGPGTRAVVWLPPGAPLPDLPSAGGAVVVVVGPGASAWRDRAVAHFGRSGADVVDTVATARRWTASEGLGPVAAGAAGAWEIASHFGLPYTPVQVEDDGVLGVVLAGAPPADGRPLAWAWARATGQEPGSPPDDVAAVLAEAGAAPTPAHVDALEPLVRARALDAVDAVDVLRAHLDDPSSVVRLVAAHGLARLAIDGGSRVAGLKGALEAAAASPDAYLRWKAAHGLGHVEGAVDVLIPLLADPDIDVKRAAARSLGRQRDPSAVPALRAALDDSNSFVRQWAARGLAELGHPDALPALLHATTDDTALVREVAADGARRLGADLQVEPYQPPRPGDPAALLAMATGPDGTARKDALKLLAGTPEGTRAAVAALRDPDSEVRKQAVEGLGWARSPQPQVVDALTDDDPDVLVTALIALRRRPVAGSEAALGPLLQHSDPEVQLRAAQALAALAQGDPTSPAGQILKGAVTNRDERIRAAAVRVHVEALSPEEPSVLVRRAAAASGGAPCETPEVDWLASTACPGTSPDAAAAAQGLLSREDDLLHLRASWTDRKDRPRSHRALRPPVLRPYGDPDRG